jgi:hypothetical protein
VETEVDKEEKLVAARNEENVKVSAAALQEDTSSTTPVIENVPVTKPSTLTLRHTYKEGEWVHNLDTQISMNLTCSYMCPLDAFTLRNFVFFTFGCCILCIYVYNFYIYIHMITCIGNTKSRHRCTASNISVSGRVRAADLLY